MLSNIIDEGASTCAMFITCWKDIISPPLTESHNTLKALNGSGFKPYGVLPSLPITLEGKMVNIEVEVFDAPLDYNLLLCHSWIDLKMKKTCILENICKLNFMY